MVGTLAAIPVLAGAAGVIFGPGFLHAARPWPDDLDSHFRFLSAIFLAIGLAWYSCIPHIEVQGRQFRRLALLTVAGGLGRLLSLAVAGTPSAGHVAGLLVELIVVPALVVWQRRLAWRFDRPPPGTEQSFDDQTEGDRSETGGANAVRQLY